MESFSLTDLELEGFGVEGMVWLCCWRNLGDLRGVVGGWFLLGLWMTVVFFCCDIFTNTLMGSLAADDTELNRA